MKIGTLRSGSTKSMLMNGLIKFTKCLAENVDEKLGYSYYRGILYSYDDTIHISLLGADIEGRFRIVKLAFNGTKCISCSKGIINEGKIALELDSLLSVIEKLPTSISKIYFDFNEKVDIDYSQCYTYEDLDEVGSNVLLIETDKSMVDTYMLKTVSDRCVNTLLCDSWSEVYSKLSNFSGSAEEIDWFRKRGVRLA